jgi:hypothetical protein
MFLVQYFEPPLSSKLGTVHKTGNHAIFKEETSKEDFLRRNDLFLRIPKSFLLIGL